MITPPDRPKRPYHRNRRGLPKGASRIWQTIKVEGETYLSRGAVAKLLLGIAATRPADPGDSSLHDHRHEAEAARARLHRGRHQRYGAEDRLGDSEPGCIAGDGARRILDGTCFRPSHASTGTKCAKLHRA